LSEDDVFEEDVDSPEGLDGPDLLRASSAINIGLNEVSATAVQFRFYTPPKPRSISRFLGGARAPPSSREFIIEQASL